jgi:hypothetical protein
MRKTLPIKRPSEGEFFFCPHCIRFMGMTRLFLFLRDLEVLYKNVGTSEHTLLLSV